MDAVAANQNKKIAMLLALRIFEKKSVSPTYQNQNLHWLKKSTHEKSNRINFSSLHTKQERQLSTTHCEPSDQAQVAKSE